MPVIKITPRDILTSRLRLGMEDVVKLDLCDSDEDLPQLRRDAHAELRRVFAEARRFGYAEGDLYQDVISDEEGRADFEADARLTKTNEK